MISAKGRDIGTAPEKHPCSTGPRQQGPKSSKGSGTELIKRMEAARVHGIKLAKSRVPAKGLHFLVLVRSFWLEQ